MLIEKINGNKYDLDIIYNETNNIQMSFITLNKINNIQHFEKI